MTAEQWADIQEMYRQLTGNQIQKMMEGGSATAYFLDAYKDWHPELPVITQAAPDQVQMMRWGVIPPFAKYIEKDERLLHPYDFGNYYSKTANAMVEGLAEKKTWKRLYKRNRCLILATGFYEFYHLPGKRVTYPHFITLKDEPVFAFAGLHDQWTDTETGEEVKSCTIITTRPNEMMTVIHNNPKAHSGARMPVMLPVAEWVSWLDGEMSYEDVKLFCEPYPAEAMQAVTVRQGLKGRDTNANIAAAQEAITYPELGSDWAKYPGAERQGSLF